MWLSHARAPLSIDAVRHALAIEAGDAELDGGNLLSAKQLVEYCSGLVVIDEESGILRLSHASVQMYLYEHRQDLFPSGEDDIAKICFTYLGFRGIYETCASICSSTGWQLPLGDFAWKQLDRFPFFTYAILNWGYHARDSTWEEYGPLLLDFLREKPDHHLRSLMGVFGLVDRSMKTYWNLEEKHWISGSRITSRSGVLHISALFGLVPIARVFIARDEAIDSRDCEGKSPIWLATLNGHEDIVRMLLHAQADPNIGDRLGRRPLQLAAASNSMPLVKLLLSAKAETKLADFEGCTPLYTAASQGFLLVVLELLKSGASPNCVSREKTALYVAAAANFPKIVRALLSAGARVDVRSVMNTGSFPALGTALHAAAHNGFANIVEMLLERADINEKLVFRDNTSRSRTSPMMLAASEGHERVVSVLLRHSADTEVTGVDGTALMYAIRRDRGIAVRQLLESGANPSAKDYSKNTPLIIAAKKGSLPLTQYLVTAGAALDAQDWKGQTALVHAIQAASYPIEQTLTENGASIRFRDALGKTAVEHALEMICPANGRFPCGILKELADAYCNNAYGFVTDWTRLREVGWEFHTCRQGLGMSIPRRRKRQVLELCLSWMGRAVQGMWKDGSIHSNKAWAKDDPVSRASATQ
jgi:ankyrin repeat protein